MSRNTVQWYPSLYALLKAVHWPYGSKEKEREAEAEMARKWREEDEAKRMTATELDEALGEKR